MARQIYGAVGFVLIGFLALYAFFDLIGELGDLGRGDYQLRQVFTFVLLSAPTNAYELFPVVVLIGTLYVLSHLASNSEYTVMRASGMSLARRVRTTFAEPTTVAPPFTRTTPWGGYGSARGVASQMSLGALRRPRRSAEIRR